MKKVNYIIQKLLLQKHKCIKMFLLPKLMTVFQLIHLGQCKQNKDLLDFKLSSRSKLVNCTESCKNKILHLSSEVPAGSWGKWERCKPTMYATFVAATKIRERHGLSLGCSRIIYADKLDPKNVIRSAGNLFY